MTQSTTQPTIHGPPPINTTRTHSMITHAQVVTVKPNPHFHGVTSSISNIPKSPYVALSDPHWRDAMLDEYNALIKNGTWILVSKPPKVNVVRSMWLYKHKFCAGGSLSRYMARLVANGRRISVTRDSRGMFLSQKKYAMKLLERAHIANCNPSRTLVDTEPKLGCDGDPVSDPILYRSLAGGLQYLTFTRPVISYVVQQICLFIHDPREPHLAALKRILCYVQGTLDFGLQLYASSSTLLVAYSDANWAGCLTTGRSTSSYCVFLGENLLHVVRETSNTLFLDLVLKLNIEGCKCSAIYLTANPVQRQRTKHIEIDIQFVRDMVARGQVCVLYVPSCYQFANIFTKGLPSAVFEEFRTSLSVRRPSAPTAEEY
ncbi:ribonuclease H-like domain-containing protein [Tanacetum coccineum]